ncbi:Uncharacterized conserved protein, DUF2249 family [Halopenitus malekzadehii]|uniref:Uncharacterized conserved protein, DUF2249 family n=2 Tax=Halopenitus malekzadehii TaxID=1267564 RepID=A0A1H6IR27_9EURY|nr:DUF2249 domain-containing protein [Halopenitus malekzadehii]SEH50454.1 Uncharacterized conserved protein, DUF2249 family [Halopenitus malekzadehii]
MASFLSTPFGDLPLGDPPVEYVRRKTDGGGPPIIDRMPTLDVRDIPPVNRHETIHDEFEAMDPGDTLTIVNDHEPKPLFYEMAAEVEAFDEEGYQLTEAAPDEYRAEFPKLE